MNYEQEINKLKAQVKNLQESFLQAQKNQTPITAKVDDSANKIVELTPYTETKIAYIDDTEIVFTDIPSGNLSIFGIDNFSMTKDEDKLILTFAPLEEVTEITISIS